MLLLLNFASDFITKRIIMGVGVFFFSPYYVHIHSMPFELVFEFKFDRGTLR